MQQWMAENGGRGRGKREGGGNRQPTNQVLPRREGTQGGKQESRHMKESAKAESKQAGEGRAAGRKAASCARPCMKLKWEGRRKEARKTARSCVKPRKYHERAENIHTPPTVWYGNDVGK